MDTIKLLGARIIELRKRDGISREELAKEFDLPYMYSDTTVKKISRDTCKM